MRQLKITQSITARDSSLNYYLREVSQERLINLDEEIRLAEKIKQGDKKALDKALARLMVFDKKVDITVLDYSKLVFKENELELISIKNNNFEKIPYISSTNAFNHESIIRFADLVKQLKAINSKEVDISYGDRPAIILNSDIYQVIPEIITKERI